MYNSSWKDQTKPPPIKLMCSSVSKERAHHQLKKKNNSLLIHYPLFPSLRRLCSDFPRSDGRVRCGGFPSNCDGEVCFLQLEVCEEELAVCHLWHWSLHQLYDHHVSQRGGCLDKHHLAYLHILPSKCFMKHLFTTLFQELWYSQPERYLIFLVVGCSVGYLPSHCFSFLPRPSPVDANKCYYLIRCMKR